MKTKLKSVVKFNYKNLVNKRNLERKLRKEKVYCN